MSKKNSYGVLIAIIVIWGISFPVMDKALSYMPPLCFVAIRFLSSALLMTIFFWKRIVRADLYQIKASLLIGLPFAVGVIFQLIGLDHTSTTNAAFITGLTVAVIPAIQWIFEKTKPTKITFIGILLSLVGVAFMSLSFQGEAQANIGDLLVFIGTIGFSVQIYTLGRIGKTIDAIVSTTFQFYIVGLCALAGSIAFEQPQIVFDKNLFFGFAFIVLLCTVVAVVGQNVAQPQVPSIHVGIIFLLEPVVAMFFARILGDVITLQQFIGAMIIIASMLLIVLFGEKKAEES